MTNVLLVVMMIVVGAIIGGLTNSLAIKMLFRPYQAKFIGSWKIPFTPGLIPKRREELAKQLGKMVMDHLLTPEGMKKKLQQPEFQGQMLDWVQEEIAPMFETDRTGKDILERFDVNVSEKDLRKKIGEKVVNRYAEVMHSYRPKELREVLDTEWLRKSEQGVHQLATHIQQQLTNYLSSEEANKQIGELVDRYLADKGFLGNMISSFLGNEGLADQIQPVVVNYIQSDEARQWIDQLLMKEHNQLLTMTVGEIETKLGSEKISSSLGEFVADTLPLEAWLNKPFREWLSPFQTYITTKLVPMAVNKAVEALTGRMDTLMERLHLSEIVEKEVKAFPISRVEEMVLNISSREFKMITYLGALLGGTIGLVQGMIVILTG